MTETTDNGQILIRKAFGSGKLKKLWAGHKSLQTDRQTDGQRHRQTEWFLHTPWNSIKGGGGIKIYEMDIVLRRKADF